MSNHDAQGDFIDPFCAGLTLFAFTGTTSEHHTVYAYGVGNRLISWSTNSYYRYDLAGSVTTIQYDAGAMISLARNSRYRVTGLQYTNPVTGTACVEEYAFDAAGRRSSITINETNVRRFIYSGEHVVGELDGDGTLVRRYTYGSGMDNILSMSIIAPGSTNTYYYIKGHNNSVHALVDSSEQIAERYEYDAWGNITVYDSTDTEVSESQLGNRYTFQGREISWASGLYYFRARWYDPTTGRWLSKDPIGIAGGLNQYVFCKNNPINFVDPDGMDPWGSSALPIGMNPWTEQGIHDYDAYVTSINSASSKDKIIMNSLGTAAVLAPLALPAAPEALATGKAWVAMKATIGKGPGWAALRWLLGISAYNDSTSVRSRHPNVDLNISAKKFQKNLLTSGFKIVH